MSTIRVLSGSYRNKPVKNQVFTLVKGFQTGKKSNYVTVQNDGQFNIDIEQVRINVASLSDFEYVNGSTTAVASTADVAPEVKETDVEAMDRIATRFSILDEMSKACINSDIRAMIVTGPPGVGKSHGVTLQMEKAALFDQIKGKRPRFEIVKGAISGIGLFALLFKNLFARESRVHLLFGAELPPSALALWMGRCSWI